MHGGDIYRNNVDLDFSVNINPMGIPNEVISAMHRSIDNASCYPDIYCVELRDSIAKRYNVSKESIICGNGASELIMAICQYVLPEKALLIAPGFSGYKRALRAIGTNVDYYYLNENDGFIPNLELMSEIKNKKPQLVFFTNPSNPTGVLMSRKYVCEIAKTCKDVGAYLVLDECFMELTGRQKECSLINEIKNYDNIFILRAFTKSFSIPGIRLGYMLCNESMVDKIKNIIPEWNVSIVAQAAGTEAIKQDEYLKESVLIIRQEREYLKQELHKLGLKVYDSCSNYLLLYCDKCDLEKELLKRKILIRDCSDYEGLKKGFFRIAVKNREENEKLINELKDIMSLFSS